MYNFCCLSTICAMLSFKEYSSYVHTCTSIRCQELTFLGKKNLWDEADKTRQKEDLYNILKSASFCHEERFRCQWSSREVPGPSLGRHSYTLNKDSINQVTAPIDKIKSCSKYQLHVMMLSFIRPNWIEGRVGCSAQLCTIFRFLHHLSWRATVETSRSWSRTS